MNLFDQDPKDLTVDMLISIGLDVSEKEKKAQIIYGQLAILLEQLTNPIPLADFAKEIGKPQKSLSSYKSTERRLLGLEIPEDISYSARRAVAASDDPKKTLQTIKDHGLSSAEILRTFGQKEEKSKKKVTCPRCNTELEVN